MHGMSFSLEKRIFIICPVRGITDDEKKIIDDYVSILESNHMKVHYPARGDTNQDDPVGLNICSQNRAAIKHATSVCQHYNPTSTGSVFDDGMSFFAGKPLFIINNEYFQKPKLTEFEDFLKQYSTNAGTCKTTKFYKTLLRRAEQIEKAKIIEYNWKSNNPDFLFDFGMSFMAEKPIILLNREEVEKQRTPHKSFQNVLLTLDDMYRNKTQ